MAQYESGQYINEFLNEMPNLLLTMRKMDVDEMLETRRLDQRDTQLDLQRNRDVIDADIRDRTTKIIEGRYEEIEKEAEGRQADIYARGKKEDAAWRAVKTPLFDAAKRKAELRDQTRKEFSEMPWTQTWFRGETSGEGLIPGVESEYERAERLAEEKVGKAPDPGKLLRQIEPYIEDLRPEHLRELMSMDMFENMMLSSTGLLGKTTASSLGGQFMNP